MMDEQEDRDVQLWASFKRAASGLPLDEPEAILRLAVRLIADWGSNLADMRRVLLQGRYRNELPEEVIVRWDARWMESVPGVESPTAAPQSDSLQLHGIPAELLPFERAIGACSRKQGRSALELGRQLLAARERCEACRFRFETFLRHIHRRYGINRATCFLYVKFVEWELPDSLGTAVMKWIVQGFERGSLDALRVIQAAAQDGLTLDALKASYGALRRPRLSSTAQTPKAITLQDEPAPELREKLLHHRQRLIALRTQIDEELCSIESRLHALEGRALSAPGAVSSLG